MSARQTLAAAMPAAAPVGVPGDMPASSAPLFQPFEWLKSEHVAGRIPSAGAVELIGRALDVSNGVGLVLRMLEQLTHDAASDDGDGNPLPPLLDSVSAGHLLRFGIAAADLLALDISRYHDTLRDHHPPEGTAQ